MWRIFYSIKATFRFRDYGPQPVTFWSAHKWMGQFEPKDRRMAGGILDNVVYFSQDKTKRTLIKLNDQLMRRLADDGFPAKKIIYVSFDQTASSSHIMLGMLRDNAALLQRGCNLCDSKNTRELKDLTDRLEDAAVVYIDDFIGSGRQFCESRDFTMQYIFANVSEFMLAPSVCEEGKAVLEERGIEVVTDRVHLKSDRALQETSTFMKGEQRARAIEVCQKINPKMALGVDGMATMVVFYRNSPNQIPALLRGNKNLKPFRGLFPRTTDLPFTRIVQASKKKKAG
jgi:hypothetical protein